MKILYIVNASGPDYLCDMVFHGLKQLRNIEIVDSQKLWYMYKIPFEIKILLYGRGFTVYGNLDEDNIDRENIEEKIESNYFDYVFYGSVHRCRDYLDIVLQNYKKNRIIFIDGEDETDILFDLIEYGIYFKRELEIEKKNIYPIQFSIPAEKFFTGECRKSKLQSDIIPGSKNNYSFYDELSYYNEYRKSYFALTCKKAGWDCLRHYEIIANKCLPVFTNIEKCPSNTLFDWPKELLIKINRLIESKNISPASLEDIGAEFFSISNKFTTENSANYILSKT